MCDDKDLSVDDEADEDFLDRRQLKALSRELVRRGRQAALPVVSAPIAAPALSEVPIASTAPERAPSAVKCTEVKPPPIEATLENLDSLKACDIRRALESRKLPSSGLKSTITSRLRSALTHSPIQQVDETPPLRSCTVLLSNFEACPEKFRISLGATVTFAVAMDDHGSAEYNLDCKEAFDNEGPPSLDRGATYRHVFQQCGSFKITDLHLPIEIHIDVVNNSVVENLRQKVREARELDEAARRRRDEQKQLEKKRVESARRKKDEALANANEAAAAKQIDSEKNDAKLRLAREAKRAKAVESSLARVLSTQGRKTRRPRRRHLDHAVKENQGESNGERSSKFAKLRGLMAKVEHEPLNQALQRPRESDIVVSRPPSRSYFAAKREHLVTLQTT